MEPGEGKSSYINVVPQLGYAQEVDYISSFQNNKVSKIVQKNGSRIANAYPKGTFRTNVTFL